MDYQMWFDEDEGVLIFKFMGTWTADNFREAITRMEELFEGRQHRYLLGDITQAPPQKYSKEFRKVVAELGPTIKIDKVAIVSLSPVLRMLAKMLIATSNVSGKSTVDAKFFKSTDEALYWLKGGAKP